MAADGAEYTGKTVEDAISKAEAALSTHRNELNIDVISVGSRGVFGIGAEPARVRASVMEPPMEIPEEIQRSTEPDPIHQPDHRVSMGESHGAEEVQPAEAAARAPVLEESGAPVTLEEPTAQPHLASHTQNDENLPAEASRVLQELLNSMGFDAQVSVRSADDPVILAVSGENLGILIGRRGDNLSSLQFMVNLILSKNRRQWPRVVIDVENYRARREESLTSLAERIAYRVGRQGRPFTLEAMPASDRRVIHLALRDRDDVETYSIGEGMSRRVVVAPTSRSGNGARAGSSEGYRPYR